MSDRQSQLNPFWKTFPQPLRSALQSIPQNSGRLDAWHCSAAMKAAGMSLEDLMVKLLPAARLYARVPISNFKVGAVVRGCIPDKPDGISLFLGANIEFAGQSLTETIHAEQTAVVNARQQGSVQIEAIAVSAAPCGRCRQFLYELDTRQLLTVIVQQADGNDTSAQKLSDLLPQAFGSHFLRGEPFLRRFGDPAARHCHRAVGHDDDLEKIPRVLLCAKMLHTRPNVALLVARGDDLRAASSSRPRARIRALHSVRSGSPATR